MIIGEASDAMHAALVVWSMSGAHITALCHVEVSRSIDAVRRQYLRRKREAEERARVYEESKAHRGADSGSAGAPPEGEYSLKPGEVGMHLFSVTPGDEDAANFCFSSQTCHFQSIPHVSHQPNTPGTRPPTQARRSTSPSAPRRAVRPTGR